MRIKNRAFLIMMAVLLALGTMIPNITLKAEAAEKALANKTWAEVHDVLDNKLGQSYESVGHCTGYLCWGLKNGYGVDIGDNGTVDDVEDRIIAKGATKVGTTTNSTPPAGAKAGDIIIFKMGSDGRHCGFYAGNGMIIHAQYDGVMEQTFESWQRLPNAEKQSDKAIFYRGLQSEGTITISKTSSNATLTTGNSNYSLQGAEYALYSGSSIIQRGTTNSSGQIKFTNVPYGTYSLREISASKNFKVSAGSVSITLDSATKSVTVKEVPKLGSLDVIKASANTDMTNGNACYSLQGAVYGLYKVGDDASPYKQATTDSSGKASFTDIPFNDYYVKEITASKGYALDTTKYNVTINSETKVTKNVKEIPQNDPAIILLGKADKELKWRAKNLPVGSASLGGAEFTVEYFDGNYSTEQAARASGGPTRTWVFRTDKDGYIDLSEDWLVSGKLYHDMSGNPCLPLGTILIHETKAPEGYLLNSEVFVRQITSSGIMESVNTYNAPNEETAVKEQVKRGDIKFVKVKDASLQRLANIPFKLTSATTGESHIIVTDANGEYQSANSWVAHNKSTNGNDAYYDAASGKITNEKSLTYNVGTWFGQDTNNVKTTVNNAMGALPYDTYILDELECDANKGNTLLKGIKIKLYRDSATVDLGMLTNDAITLETSAIDEEIDGRTSLPRENVTIVDTITYDGVIPGEEHTIKGVLVDGESGDPITVKGKEVRGETTFTPKQTKGQETVEFTFDASEFAGKKIVVCEVLEKSDAIIATHEDIFDEKQTITFVKPNLDTVALDDESGTHMAYADDSVSITDTIEYSGLLGKYEYKLTGTLIDYATGEPILINGQKVTESETFYSNTAKGTRTMHFTFDGTGLEGKTIGVAQTLTWNGVKVAEHKDIKDEDQAIHFPKITTSVKDDDSQGHMSMADDIVSITDTVSYENVIPNSNLTLTGRLINTETGEPLVNNGKIVEKTVEFTANAAKGTQDVTFEFDGHDLAGETFVCFEILAVDKHTLATHTDLNDEKQTIHFPKIQTMAVDSETEDHIALADDQVTVTDTVTYENVVAGEDFTLKGELMQMGTTDPMLNDSNPITGETTFNAKSENGTAKVEFTFDASDFANMTGVVFESLEWNGHVVAEHKANTDENQAVHFPEVGTTLLDTITKDHIALADNKVKLTDTVLYKNLLVGKEYTVNGTLYDKNTNTEIKVNGKPVVGTATFTPDKPNGTVDVEFEFDASDLKGVTVVAMESLEFKGHVVGEHKDPADMQQWVRFPKVLTVALDGETGEHIAFADENVSITDEVSYENVIVGEEYTAVGKLMDANTEKPLLIDGHEVTASTTFTAKAENGKESVTFNFDGSSLEGKTLVVYETLYYKGDIVGLHCDLNDKSQTVKFPRIRTTALDSATKEHVSFADNEVIITDTVKYENVLSGKEYTAKGTLMDRDSGKPLMSNGKEITAEATFTAEAENGTADVVFKFDATGLENKTAVAFETLEWDSHVVAKHEDLTDAEQSVHFPKIGTTADMSYAKGNNVKLVDTVAYENLKTGLTYTAKGYLVDAETGEPIKMGGTEVSAKTRFTPENADGTVKVEFNIDATDLEGKTVVIFEEVTFGTEIVGEHKDLNDTDQTVKFPKVRTTAVDKETNNRVSLADDDITVVDTVTYENVNVGETYKVVGTLMDKDEDSPLLDKNGKEITAEAEFTAEEESGTVEVTFHFDGSNLNGKTAVAFEDLLTNGKVVGRHADIDDEDQTVFIPKLHTTAVEKESGDKIALIGKNVTIKDTVEYRNLLVGEEYKLSGRLIDKETGKEIELINPVKVETAEDETVDNDTVDSDESGTDETVTVADSNSTEILFTPTEPNGTVELELTFDASKMANKSAVVFESAYLDDTPVAVHEDINDEDQTVSFEAPQSVQTYQTLPWQIVIAIASAIIALLAVAVTRRRA